MAFRSSWHRASVSARCIAVHLAAASLLPSGASGRSGAWLTTLRRELWLALAWFSVGGLIAVGLAALARRAVL